MSSRRAIVRSHRAVMRSRCAVPIATAPRLPPLDLHPAAAFTRVAGVHRRGRKKGAAALCLSVGGREGARVNEASSARALTKQKESGAHEVKFGSRPHNNREVSK